MSFYWIILGFSVLVLSSVFTSCTVYKQRITSISEEPIELAMIDSLHIGERVEIQLIEKDRKEGYIVRGKLSQFGANSLKIDITKKKFVEVTLSNIRCIKYGKEFSLGRTYGAAGALIIMGGVLGYLMTEEVLFGQFD